MIHIRYASLGEVNKKINKYQCDYCGQILSGRNTLRTHLANVHGIDAKFKCPICGKNFQRKAVYEDHVNSHSGTKTHFCSMCNKGFIHKATLMKHKPICGKP